MPLTPEQAAKRRRTNTVIFKIFSVVFILVALLFLVSGRWWLGLTFLLVGLFMVGAWFR